MYVVFKSRSYVLPCEKLGVGAPDILRALAVEFAMTLNTWCGGDLASVSEVVRIDVIGGSRTLTSQFRVQE